MYSRKTVLGIALIALLGFSAFGGGYWYASATLPTADGTWGQWWRDAYLWVSTAAHLDYGSANGVLFLNSGKNVTTDSDIRFVTDTLTVTKLGATTLAGDISAAGNDLTGAGWVNGTSTAFTNAYVTTYYLGATNINARLGGNWGGLDLTNVDDLNVTDTFTSGDVWVKNDAGTWVNATDVLAYPETSQKYVVWNDTSTIFVKDSDGRVTRSTNATAQLLTVLATGGDVLLKDGTYSISQKLMIPTNTYLHGESMSATIIRWIGAANGTMIEIATSNTMLSNLYINCNNLANIGVNVDGGASIWANNMQNIYIINSIRSGLRLDQLDGSVFINVRSVLSDSSNASGDAITINQGTALDLIGCQGTHSVGRRNGLDLGYSTNTRFFGGQFSRVDVYRCNQANFYGVDIEEDQSTIALNIGGEATYSSSFIGCYISNDIAAAGKAINIYDGIKNVNIQGCTLTGTTLANWLRIVGGSHATMIANDIEAGTLDGAAGTVTFLDNYGYVTQNSGTATVLNGATSKWVTHGCSFTPTAKDVTITFTEKSTFDFGTW